MAGGRPWAVQQEMVRHMAVLLLVVLSLTVAGTPEVSMLHEDDGEGIISSFEDKVSKIEQNSGYEANLGESAPDVQKLLGKIKTKPKKKVPEPPIIPRNTKMFSSIPNMVYPGTVENVKNKDGCMDHCINRPKCRSYSYNPKENKCFWSTGSLRYSHEWNFYTKEFETNAFGKAVPTNEFFALKGIFAIDQGTNMRTERDKSLEDCKELCVSDKKCMSFSYHDVDYSCLMGKAKVHYRKGWMYHERNQRPRSQADKWLPYPMEMDSYQKKLKAEEESGLRALAERAEKKHVSRMKKEDVVKTVTKREEKKTKRLDKEMKTKAFGREQTKKKREVINKKRKADKDAAAEKGKFDESFHKQEIINNELLHKRSVEKNVKLAFMDQLKEKGEKREAKLNAKLAVINARARNHMIETTRIIKQNEKLHKNKKKRGAVDLKAQAFKLVGDERNFKSGRKYNKGGKKNAKKLNKKTRKQWAESDRVAKEDAKMEETKAKIQNEKNKLVLKQKLANEKAGKKAPPGHVPGAPLPKQTHKLPEKPKPPKEVKVQDKAPGTEKPKLDVPSKPKNERF